MKAQGEGSLQAPTRHPLNWKEDSFWQPDELNEELAEFLTYATAVAVA